MYIIDRVLGKTPGRKRSPKWPGVRAAFLRENPVCAACGSTASLEVHHVVPFHEDPALELEPENLITLCTSKKFGINCHLFVGHRGSFVKKNVNVHQTADDVLRHLTCIDSSEE